MKKHSLLLLVSLRRLVAGCTIAGAALGAARADVVTVWNRTLESALRNPTPSIPVQARVAATLQTAIFDAVNGITRRYSPMYVKAMPPPGARQAAFDVQLAASFAQIPGSAGSAASIAAGRAWG